MMESKKVQEKNTHRDSCQRDIGANWKSTQWQKLEQSEQQNK